MIDIEKRGDMWWPKNDVDCYRATSFEVDDIHYMMSFCQGKRRMAVQAGGNCGVWPLELATYFDKVISFEPDPQNFACLEANTLKNNRIIPINAGLGDSKEMVDLCREQKNCGAYFVKGTGTIKIITLDLYDLNECNFLQLDVEGYEYKALKGAAATIKRCRPVIVCEEKGLGDRYGETNHAIATFLHHFNYKLAGKINNDVIYAPN